MDKEREKEQEKEREKEQNEMDTEWARERCGNESINVLRSEFEVL